MLSLLIDENFNHRILRGLLRSIPHLDYKLIPEAGLKGAEDPVVLDFAARDGRVFVTHDLKTVPKYAYERINAGSPVAGVIAIPDSLAIGKAIEDLATLIECCKPSELVSLVFYLPL